MVLVYISSNNGIAKSVVETITYARKLSNDVVVITTGAASQDDLAQLGKYGASSVKVDRAILGGDSQQLSRLISSLALSLSADTVLFSHDVIGKAVAPRVSVQLKAGLVSGAIALPEENGSIKVNVFSGKAMGFVHVKSAVKIISLLPNSIPAELNGSNCPVEEINGDAGAALIKVISVKRPEGDIPLPEAELVVSAGRGMKGPENWGMI